MKNLLILCFLLFSNCLFAQSSSDIYSFNQSLTSHIKAEIIIQRQLFKNKEAIGSLTPKIDSAINVGAEFHCYWNIKNKKIGHDETNTNFLKASGRFYDSVYGDSSYINTISLLDSNNLSYNQTSSRPNNIIISPMYGFGGEIVCRIPNNGQSKKELAKDIVSAYMKSIKGHREMILGRKYTNSFGSFTLLDKTGQIYYNVILFGYRNLNIDMTLSFPIKPSKNSFNKCLEFKTVCDKEIQINRENNDGWLVIDDDINIVSDECILLEDNIHSCSKVFRVSEYYKFYEELITRRKWYQSYR